MKIDPYYQPQKCRPMTSFWRYKTCANIRGGSPGRGRQKTEVLSRRTAIFSDFAGYFSDTSEMRTALLYGDMQSVVGFSVIPKCMTLNDIEWLFRVKFCFRAGLSGFRPCKLSKIIAWKLIKIYTHCYEIQYMWTARSTETETETGLDGYVMLGAMWLTEY